MILKFLFILKLRSLKTFYSILEKKLKNLKIILNNLNLENLKMKLKVNKKLKNKEIKKEKKNKKAPKTEDETQEEEQINEIVDEQKMQVEEEPKKEEEKQSESENEDGQKDDDEEVLGFTEMGIDDRILLAILELGWLEPTPIQETAIPLILEGRDILAKARTGSGKTGAYAIPILQKILAMKKRTAAKQVTTTLILTPSRELCSQAHKNLQELMIYCQREITVVDLSSSQLNQQSQKQILATRPDIIVSTPTKILSHLKEDSQTNYLDLKSSLELLVIDEADLLLSFGYEEEMKTLVK